MVANVLIYKDRAICTFKVPSVKTGAKNTRFSIYDGISKEVGT